MASPQPAIRPADDPHFHLVGETCPVCDQPIPNDKAEAIRERMEARERELAVVAKAAAATEFAGERTRIEKAATAAIQKAREESADAIRKVADEAAAKEAAARAAGKADADADLQEKLAAAERAKANSEEASAARIAALEQAAKTRDEEWQTKVTAAESAGQQRAAALELAAQEREADWQEKLSAAERAKAQAEEASAARITALEEAAKTRDEEWQNKVTAAESAGQQRMAAFELAAQGREADWQEKVAAAEREKQGAMTQLETLKAEQDKTIGDRVQEARDALERDKTDALNAEKARHAEETQKLTGKLETLTRQLEKKTAEELGEGAEVKLFDALKAEFDGDKIDRVGKGVSGADIIHIVMHNGRECGKIIYDSKNSTGWRDDYVTKLVQDQTAAKADYAVLSTFKFPSGAKQVEVRESIIIVNPARAVTIAQIIRKHLLQVHTLRLSKSERAEKMAALFDYVTSARCAHLLERIETHSDALLKLQEAEVKAHEKHWKQEGALLKNIQKVKAELTHELDTIIGTHEPDNDSSQP
ncbi:MAG: DUF2130 domain-containing protein [Alphaproteobacteria bacterium]|nr:DUF2130 domain-containing protein [Alphaproteobacteria bacterium]MBV8412257.1 DUF2130 domain-containing protein [Alphaproteobacteria bacterium]